MSELKLAAFHAWLCLGEVLLDFKESRPKYKTTPEEIQECYDALGKALADEGEVSFKHPPLPKDWKNMTLGQRIKWARENYSGKPKEK